MPRKPVVPVPQDDLTTTLELVSLADLRPHPRNDGHHPPAEIAHLKQSIMEHDIYRNIVIAQDGTLLAGHGVVQAASEAGRTHIAALRKPYGPDDPRALKLLAGDNHISRLREQDDAALVALLEELSRDDPLALLGTGFDEASLAALAEAQGLGDGGSTEDAGRDVEPQVDRAEELREQWGVEAGQLWACGEHRVICGDCTDKTVIECLMSGKQATLVVTDPPYGVSYADKNAFLNMIGRANSIETPIVNDHMPKAQMQALWKAAFTVMAGVMAPGGVVYCFMPQGGDQMMMMMMMEGAGIEPRHELIWVKNNHVLGRVDYAYKHEPILYAWKAGGHKFYGDFQTSLLEYPKPQKSDLHPTTKPVALVERLVENSSQQGEVVYDGFVGAGTTLMACENLGRTCYSADIDAGYVAVTLQRYCDLTGDTPQRLE